MTEPSYSAQAITNETFGDPEIIIFRNKVDPETGHHDPHEIIQRADLPYQTLSDGEQILADADEVLAEMGWRTIPAGSINDGWDTTDFGNVAFVEPID